MSRHNNILERIKQSKLHLKSLIIKPEITPSLEKAKIDIEPQEQDKNNIDDLNLKFGKGINLLEDYKLEEPKKKGRRKKSEFNGSFNF